MFQFCTTEYCTIICCSCKQQIIVNYCYSCLKVWTIEASIKLLSFVCTHRLAVGQEHGQSQWPKILFYSVLLPLFLFPCSCCCLSFFWFTVKQTHDSEALICVWTILLLGVYTRRALGMEFVWKVRFIFNIK